MGWMMWYTHAPINSDTIKRKPLSMYDLFKPPTEDTKVFDEKMFRANQREFHYFINCFALKKLKIVGEVASADEVVADPEQTAKDSHSRRKKAPLRDKF